MSEIQAWVMQLCIACVLVSVILIFVKNDKANNSIKTVLALYILLTAITPFAKNGGPSINFEEFTVESSAKIDARQVVKSTAENEIAAKINEKFTELELNAVCKRVELSADLSQAQTIAIACEENSFEKAESAVLEIAGEKTTVINEKEG